MQAPSPSGRLGAGDPCPLCGAKSGVAESDDGWACLACGGPRILVDAPVARSGTEKPLLLRARSLSKRRALWGVLAGSSGALGALSLAVAAVLSLVIHLGEAGGEIAAALALGPLLFSAFGFSRVRSASSALRSTLADAEVAVATDLAAAKGSPLEGAELSRMMHVSVERGEQLAASLQVESFLHEGDTTAPPTRVRVEQEAPGATNAPEPDAETGALRHKRSP